MVSSPHTFNGRMYETHRPIQAAPSQVSGRYHASCCAPSTDRLLACAGTSQHATQGPRQKVETLSKSAAPKQRKHAAHRQGLLKSKSLKRTRSVAQGLAPNRKAVTGDTTPGDVEPTVEVVTEESHTFYIGDIEAFRKFLTRRFDELTMKPLRGIAGHWVKIIEPRRLTEWGKYHEMKPSEAEKTPPWWPQDVIYKEPSHLTKEGKCIRLQYRLLNIPNNPQTSQHSLLR